MSDFDDADFVDILDLRVPIQFYKALNPVRQVTPDWVESAIVEDMVAKLKKFLDDVISQTLADTELQMRSGRLRNALYSGVSIWGGERVNDIRAHLMVPPYVAAQELGAEIFPRRAKVLCVPLPPALRSDGTPKRRYPALWKPLGTFSYVSKKTGKSYLAYKNGEQLIVLYVYVDVVKLPARLGLTQHYRDMLPILMTMWENILVDAVNNAFFGNIERIFGEL